MKLIKIEAIEDLFAVKGGAGDNANEENDTEENTTIVVHCYVANSGNIQKNP